MVSKSEIYPYRRIKTAFEGETIVNSVDKLSKIKEVFSFVNMKRYGAFSIIGFLLGRAVVLNTLSPFGLAFLSVSILHELNMSLAAVSVLLGVISIAQKELILKYIISTIALIVLYVATGKIKLDKKLTVSILAAVTNAAAGYFVFYMKNYFMYDLLMVIIESILIGVFIYVYDNAFPVIKNIHKRKMLSSEEILSLCILAAFCFVGADFLILTLSIKNISIILLVLMFSYTGSAGTGAALGIIFGIVQALSGAIIPSAIGVYGLCGLLCGILKNLGKAGCAIGFIIGNALMTFYINGSTEVLIKFSEIAAASCIFMLIPQSLYQGVLSFNSVFSSDYTKEKSFNKRLKDYTKDKLKEISEVFNELSVTLKESVKDNEYFSQYDAANIIDQVVNKCCSSCGMCTTCWKRNFYKTYQQTFSMLSLIESEGEADMKIVSQGIKDRCMKPIEMATTLKHSYELYRNSIAWKRKINEGRLVVCDQLREVSAVVSNLALQVNLDINFNRDMEELIMVALDSEGIAVEDVVVAQAGGFYEVDLKIPACGGRRGCVKDIIPVVNKVVGRKFAKSNALCSPNQANVCSIKLKEAQKYQVATGLSRANKSGAVSGDNYSFTELRDGKFMLALSDGMGTGPKADVESNATIRLLEKFLYAGFDKDVAVKTINSLLLMKSNEESYATIDMTVINQYNGEVEFVKVGAVSTFIKHQEGVDVIKVGSLPVGILSSIDMEYIRRKLKDGEFVVMVSDGILDSNKDEIDKEQWLADMIQDINTRNPQRMADDILKRCLEYTGGYAADDMTVMVAKIWETV